jgi:hypothetical protein
MKKKSTQGSELPMSPNNTQPLPEEDDHVTNEEIEQFFA